MDLSSNCYYLFLTETSLWRNLISVYLQCWLNLQKPSNRSLFRLDQADQVPGTKTTSMLFTISFAQTILVSGMPRPRYQRSSLLIPRISGDTCNSVTMGIVTTSVTWYRRWWSFWGKQLTAWWRWSQIWQLKNVKWRKPVRLCDLFLQAGDHC